MSPDAHGTERGVSGGVSDAEAAPDAAGAGEASDAEAALVARQEERWAARDPRWALRNAQRVGWSWWVGGLVMVGWLVEVGCE